MVRRQRYNICSLQVLAGLMAMAAVLFWGTPLLAGGNVGSGFSLDGDSLQDLFPTWDHSQSSGQVQPQPIQVMPPVTVPMPMPVYPMPAGQPVQVMPVQQAPTQYHAPVPMKSATPPTPSIQTQPDTGIAGRMNPAAPTSQPQTKAPYPEKLPVAGNASPAPNAAKNVQATPKPVPRPVGAGSDVKMTKQAAPRKTVETGSDLVITENNGHTIFELTEASAKAVAASDFFTLEECIEVALQVNPNMMNAAWDVKGAEWEQKKAAGDFLPSATLRYSYAMLDETPRSSQTGALNGDRESYSAKTTITQPIFTGFALMSRYELARLGLDTAQIRHYQARLDLILETKQYYYLLLQARKNLEVASQSVQQLEAHLKDARHYYEVGLVPKIQYLEAQVKLAQAVQTRTVAQNDVEYACARMNTLLRRPIDSPLEVLDLVNPLPPYLHINDCMAEALLHRPEILAAEQGIKVSDQDIKLAASGFYPNVSVAYSYEKEGDNWDVNGSRFKDSNGWNVSAQADWTIWDWGRTYKDVQVKKTEQHKAYNTLDQVKEIVVLEVKKNYLALESATQNIDVSQKAMEQAEENYRLNNERYQAQIATSTEVTDAQTLLTQAKINYYNALYQMALAQAALERAMGIEEATL